MSQYDKYYVKSTFVQGYDCIGEFSVLHLII